MLRGIARGGNIAGHVRSNSVGVHRCLQQFLYGPVVFSRTACNQALRASQSPRSPMLRSFGRGTLSTAGFFAWLISCAWLFEEYCYEWVVCPVFIPAAILLTSNASWYSSRSFPILAFLLAKYHSTGEAKSEHLLIDAKSPLRVPQCTQRSQVRQNTS